MKLHSQLNQPWHLSSLRYWGQNSLWAYRGTEATQYIDLYTIWIYSCKDLRWKSDIKFRLVLVLLRPKCVSLFLFFSTQLWITSQMFTFSFRAKLTTAITYFTKKKQRKNKQTNKIWFNSCVILKLYTLKPLPGVHIDTHMCPSVCVPTLFNSHLVFSAHISLYSPCLVSWCSLMSASACSVRDTLWFKSL